MNKVVPVSLFGVSFDTFDSVKLISEQAHYSPRTSFNLAQILTLELLSRLINNCKNTNCDIVVWPEQLTPRALHKLRQDKGHEDPYKEMYDLPKCGKDKYDCEAICYLIQTYPDISANNSFL